MNARRGFAVLEAVAAIVVVAALATALAVMANRQSRASQRLWEQREAVRMAEEAAMSLHWSRPVQAEGVAVVKMQAAAPTGMRWVRITANHAGQGASLVALVPEGGRP